MDWLSAPLDLLFEWILPAFGQEHFATVLGMFGVAGFCILVLFAVAKTIRTRASLGYRTKLIRSAINANPADPRTSFASRWNDIDEAMSRRQSPSDRRIADAWREFKETLVDESETPIRNTARPRDFLNDAVHPPHWLDLAANIFVGLGLVCTFLGLVAALTLASDAINAGGEMQGQLRQLLHAASTKFITSIVGVTLSILLKIVDRALTRRLFDDVDVMCGFIERGLLYTPLQKLSIDQLAELREQTAQFKTLNTELAVKIGDRLDQSFQTALAPVVQSFQTLNTTLQVAQDRQIEAIREGVRGSVSSATGAELASLATVLGELQTGLSGMQSAVQSSGQSASAQIGAAAEQFGHVVADMRTAFDEMANRMNTAGEQMNRQGEAQLSTIASRIEGSLAALQTANERQSRALQESTGRLQQETQTAMSTYRTLAEEAGQHMAASAKDAVRSASESARAELQSALTGAQTQLQDAVQKLGSSLNASVSQIQAVLSGFDRVSLGIKANSDALEASAGQSKGASQKLGQAATAFGAAGAAANGSVGQLARVSEQLGQMVSGVAASLEQARTLHTSITETQAQVSGAWKNYSSRFEGVDEQLGHAVEKLGQVFADAHEKLKANVSDMDGKLGQAVTSLASFVDPLTDSVESLNDLAERLRIRRAVAAE
jgi:ABC-type transporter Mla subunit MlaD